jgi:hypothetical protein
MHLKYSILCTLKANTILFNLLQLHHCLLHWFDFEEEHTSRDRTFRTSW